MIKELHVPNYKNKEKLQKQLGLSADEFDKIMDGRMSIIINDIKSGDHVLFKAGSCVKPEYRAYIPDDTLDKICQTGCHGLYNAAKKKDKNTLEDLFITIKNPNENMDIEYQLHLLNAYNYMHERKRLRNGNKMIAIKELEIANLVNEEKLCDINAPQA